jgi:chromosome segregation ATPase
LSPEEVKAIRQELGDMKKEAETLRLSLIAQEKASATLSDRLANLEQNLDDTAQKLASSEISLVQCQQNLEKAREDLEALKKEYFELNRSLTRQKNETRVWKTIAAMSLAAAIYANRDSISDAARDMFKALSRRGLGR